MLASRHLRWIGPTLVLGIAVLLRFWALDRPSTLVFDELFYVRDAISQLAHGFPTTWPDDEPSMAGERATAFSAIASQAVHPPLGKWLIGLGILVFGPENGWGWRSAAALFGVLTVGIVMRLGWLLSRSTIVACFAGLILALDGVHVTLSRVSILDGFLAFFVALGALLVWKDLEWTAERAVAEPVSGRIPILWGRPWLFVAGAVFGLAAAVKWSGLYPLAAFLILVTAVDLARRLRFGERLATLRALAQACVAGAVALPAAAIAYLASWTGWIVSPGAWGRSDSESWFTQLLAYHSSMFTWHSTLSAPHPYQARPFGWPLGLRPTGMYEARWSEGCPWSACISAVSPFPNLLITWGGLLALIALAWLAARAASLRRRNPVVLVASFLAVGFLSGWLPWVLTISRSAVFQFYAVVLTPFTALALAIALGMLCGIRIAPRLGIPDSASTASLRPVDSDTLLGRRAAVVLFLAFALALSIWFFPVWSGAPVAEWFWRMHLWLPGWD